MKIKKEYLIAGTFAVILTCIIAAITLFSLSQEKKTGEGSTDLTPIPQTTRPTGRISLPSETKTNPPIKYSVEKAERMLEKLKNNAPLSESDSLAKQKILTLLPAGQVSGAVYSSSTVIIYFTSAVDNFQGEILTVDVVQAKKDAVVWFRSQGLSQKAICDMPVVFHLGVVAARQLRNMNIQFNPLAEGC
ncbi:MAG TPA: hypothetical protein VNA13_00955 [Xanthomonadales bacterium]|nr:hypothetical protein [Xanthomonadales bacterium]